MSGLPDVQPYLKSICDRYQQWWKGYAFMDEIDASTWFEFELTSRTEDKPKSSKEKPPDKLPSQPVLQAIEEYANEKILIVGSSGAGKSTLLARIFWQAAERARHDETAPIPVLVELKAYQLVGDRSGIRGLILNSLESHDPSLDSDDLKKLLKQKRLLLLVDGLNELQQPQARTDLKRFCLNIPLIATARHAGDGWEIERKLELQPLSQHQVSSFLEIRLPTSDRVRLQELSDRVRDFGQTPLMVWMLYCIFRTGNEIPETRGEAYRKFTNLYVERSKEGIDLDESRFLLSRLAFGMMQSQKPNDPTDFQLDISEVNAQNLLGSEKELKLLRDCHLLQSFGESGKRRLRFCHQSLQEYYAAEYLLTQLPKLLEDQQGNDDLKSDYLNYLKWTEPVALMLGLVESEAQAVRVVELAIEVDLVLGAKLAGKVSVHLQNYTVELLNCLDVQFIGNIRRFGESEKQTVRVVDRRTLTQSLRDEYFEQLPKRKKLVGLGLIVNLPQFSDALKVRLLSASGSEAAIPKMVEALEQAIEQENFDIRDAVIIGLVKSSSIQKIPILVNLFLHQEDLGRYLINILVDTATEDSNQILKSILENCPPQTSSELSGWISERYFLLAEVKQLVEVNPAYLEEQQFSTNEVRSWLYQMSESGKNGNESLIRLLINTLKDTEAPDDLRSEALDALRRIKNHPQVALAVFEMLDDELCECMSGVHASVLDGIGELGDITMLIPLFEHMFYTLGNIEVCWDDEWDKVLKAIASIQSRYQFYNYEIFQDYLEAQKPDRQKSQNSDRSPITQNFYASVNAVAGNVEGNLITPPPDSVE
ncbi:MAG: NACHT domain-containing protein [Phormidesmis sp. CAN_BIN44]|nr:NACHT domain-containing protein [Phormidesmis sp. CAN_BIN44]